MKKISLFSILIVIIGTGALAVLTYASFKESQRNQQIEEKIVAMKEEAQKIKSNNESLREKIAYFETSQFQEGVAKEKLNLQKPGERVIIIKPSPYKEESFEENNKAKTEPLEEKNNLPNYRKWWNQFFE